MARTADTASAVAAVHFGDPAHPRSLRDLLEARVEAVPSGGEIAWATYYFRDRALAAALVRARQRGVRVTLALEAHPRTPAVNHAVAALLADGLGPRLRLVRGGLFRHLHAKLYCFSHPRPAALLGSFNPSGDTSEDRAILARVGDQDRGHNLLAELHGPLVEPLRRYARAWHAGEATPSQTLVDGSTRVELFPQRRNPLLPLLDDLPPAGALLIAASHISDPAMIGAIARAARRGAHVRIVAEATHRRISASVERRLRAAGIDFARWRHPDGLPMHAKFVLGEGAAGCWSAFGSFNLTWTSRWLNRELLAIDADPALHATLRARWNLIRGEAAQWAGAA